MKGSELSNSDFCMGQGVPVGLCLLGLGRWREKTSLSRLAPGKRRALRVGTWAAWRETRKEGHRGLSSRPALRAARLLQRSPDLSAKSAKLGDRKNPLERRPPPLPGDRDPVSVAQQLGWFGSGPSGECLEGEQDHGGGHEADSRPGWHSRHAAWIHTPLHPVTIWSDDRKTLSHGGCIPDSRNLQ